MMYPKGTLLWRHKSSAREYTDQTSLYQCAFKQVISTKVGRGRPARRPGFQGAHAGAPLQRSCSSFDNALVSDFRKPHQDSPRFVVRDRGHSTDAPDSRFSQEGVITANHLRSLRHLRIDLIVVSLRRER